MISNAIQRLRGSGTSSLCSIGAPLLKRKAQKSWAAVQDTFFSTKDTFERHRVVFTVGTSIASVLTAWFGYSLRHLHETNVERRLDSIEKAMKRSHDLEHSDIQKIVGSGSCSLSACVATAGTTLVVGYGLGWRGGRWYADRKFRREQMKVLGLNKPGRWQLLRKIKPRLPVLRKQLTKHQASESVGKKSGSTSKDVSTTDLSEETHQMGAAAKL